MHIRLRTYTVEEIPVLGKLAVQMQYLGQEEELLFIIIVGDGRTLLGRDWLAKLKLAWKNIFYMHAQEPLADVLERHEAVVRPGLGKIKGVQAKLHLNPEARPHFYKPQLVPYALRQKVEQELDRLEEDGLIVPVQHSEWAAPLVPVVKSNGSVRRWMTVSQLRLHHSSLNHHQQPYLAKVFAVLVTKASRLIAMTRQLVID